MAADELCLSESSASHCWHFTRWGTPLAGHAQCAMWSPSCDMPVRTDANPCSLPEAFPGQGLAPRPSSVPPTSADPAVGVGTGASQWVDIAGGEDGQSAIRSSPLVVRGSDLPGKGRLGTMCPSQPQSCRVRPILGGIRAAPFLVTAGGRRGVGCWGGPEAVVPRKGGLPMNAGLTSERRRVPDWAGESWHLASASSQHAGLRLLIQNSTPPISVAQATPQPISHHENLRANRALAIVRAQIQAPSS